MKKLFSKRTIAVVALSLFGFGFIPKIVPFGPKLPPVEFMQGSPNIENVTNLFL